MIGAPADRYSTGRQARSINPILFEAGGGNDSVAGERNVKSGPKAEIFRLPPAGS
jgi:hypothetical protein